MLVKQGKVTMTREEHSRLRKLDKQELTATLNEIAGKSYLEGKQEMDEQAAAVTKKTHEALKFALDNAKGIGVMKRAEIARLYGERMKKR